MPEYHVTYYVILEKAELVVVTGRKFIQDKLEEKYPGRTIQILNVSKPLPSERKYIALQFYSQETHQWVTDMTFSLDDVNIAGVALGARREDQNDRRSEWKLTTITEKDIE